MAMVKNAAGDVQGARPLACPLGATAAARRCHGPERLQAAENKGLGSGKIAPANAPLMRNAAAMPGVDPSFRLMKAPLLLLPPSRRIARAMANQRAVLISAANATGCLPSNGYMDDDTTATILTFIIILPCNWVTNGRAARTAYELCWAELA
jgi:hypothetical protein